MMTDNQCDRYSGPGEIVCLLLILIPPRTASLTPARASVGFKRKPITTKHGPSDRKAKFSFSCGPLGQDLIADRISIWRMSRVSTAALSHFVLCIARTFSMAQFLTQTSLRMRFLTAIPSVTAVCSTTNIPKTTRARTGREYVSKTAMMRHTVVV